MANAPLQQAYALIQQGDKDAALQVIDSLLRTDRDNRDAWWLLAHAAADRAQQRRALNEVLRLDSGDARAEQARLLLHKLDQNPDDSLAAVDAMLQAQGQPSLAARQGGLSCWRIGLIIVGIFACILTIGAVGVGITAVNLAQDFVTAPDGYTEAGMLVLGEAATGRTSAGEDRIGYTYTATAGEQVRLTIESLSSGSGAPLVFVFDAAGQLIGGTNTELQQVSGRFAAERSGEATLQFAQAGTYRIIVRPFCALGACIGLSEYALRLEAPPPTP